MRPVLRRGLALWWPGWMLLAVACQPTVQLGSDRAVSGTDGSASGTGGPSTAAVDATSAASDSMSGSGPTETMPSSVGSDDTGGPRDPTDSGPTDSGPGSTGVDDTGTSGGFVCIPSGQPRTCLECAESECCDEIEFCLGQQACSCFYSCLQQDDSPEDCQSGCESASGIAAVMSCLNMDCQQRCQSP